MGKSRNVETTQRTELDPNTQRFLDAFRRRALAREAQFQGDPFQFERGQFQNLTRNLGFAQGQGLEGIEAFFDPFQEEVISGVQSDFDRQRLLAQRRAAEQATRAGAFGGSRGAVLEAEFGRGINELEAQRLGQLRSGGFESAANRLLGERRFAANLGLAGLRGLQGLQGQLDQRQLAALSQLGGAIGPFQGTQITQEPVQGNPFLGFLGGAATLGGIPGVSLPAALIGGGGLGLLGGL